VFIDSLAQHIATDAARMPVLARLAAEGASFEVEPCRDQLTYLCLRAALTGRDDSSLFAISDNFRPNHEGPPETLLSALAAQGRQVVVVGSDDFHPYRRALSAEHALGKRDETPERIAQAYAAVKGSGASLVIMSLTSGDMVAHAHGVGAPEYYETFSRLDRAVGALASELEPGTSLVVFGDHGHDLQGRHLPGTASRTWAVYHGPAFQAGAKARLRITDHRALLGVLMGVPTEPIYQGPALSTIFEPSWVARALGGSPPALQAPLQASGLPVMLRSFAVLGLLLLVVGGTWVVFRDQPERLVCVGIATAGGVLAVGVGLGFDGIRMLVHDHGGDAWRGLCLLVPLGIGCGGAWLLRRLLPTNDGEASSWWRAASAGTLLVTLMLMLPTAYYYGSRRAIVLAGVVALVFMFVDYVMRRPSRRELVLPGVAVLVAGAVLISFYQVKQLGPETGGAAAWSLDAPIFTRMVWIPTILAKVVLFRSLVALRAGARRVDLLLASLLLAVSAGVELSGVRLPRGVYAALVVALLAGGAFGGRRHFFSLFAGALLLLDHLYSVNQLHLAPIQTLLATTALLLLAWDKLRLTARAEGWAIGLTLAVAAYLMFWPMVGFHVVGIDFGYMFQWVPEENYEKAWRLIALGVTVKLALPLILVLAVGWERLRDPFPARVLAITLAGKVAFLALMITSYAVWHDVTSQVALAMLAELALMMFGACACLVAIPTSGKAGAVARGAFTPARAALE
jgi:Type I phosphodiesterase / nucleotide pyrophosphatase